MKQLKKIHHSSEIKSFILYEILKIRYIFGIQKLMTYCTLINNSNRFLVLILKVTLLKKPFILIFCRENLLKNSSNNITRWRHLFYYYWRWGIGDLAISSTVFEHLCVDISKIFPHIIWDVLMWMFCSDSFIQCVFINVQLFGVRDWTNWIRYYILK